MKKDTQVEVCSQCHKDVRAELLRTSHHPMREGKMECSDCHNPHGTVSDKLIAANTVNEKCYECHAEKRGPFIWEHAPVIEDCTSCHTPHGSSHDKLLNARTPFLCQRCHSNSRHPGTMYAQSPTNKNQSVYSALNNRAFYRNCLNSHSQVHGSNHPSGKSLAR
jgi:DmsE family decaheme c-type cytochrome